MRAEIRDRESLSEVSIADLQTYLRLSGWANEGSWAERATVFAKDVNGETITLKVPISSDFADYPSIVKNVISTVASVEQKSEISVFRDVSEISYDVVRIRTPDSIGSGAVALDLGVDMVLKAHALLVSAAQFTHLGPRAIFQGRRANEVNEYLDQALLGQTEIGSFVVTLLSPVSPSLGQTRNLIDDPFSRRVVRSLEASLDAARKAVIRTIASDSDEPFVEARTQGVSANLCSALGEILEEDHDVNFSVSYSPRRPQETAGTVYRYPQESARIFGEIAKIIRAREPLYQEQVQGMVMRIEVEQPQETFGAIVYAMVDGHMRNVRGTFGRADYEILSQAQKDHIEISFVSNLRNEGRIWSAEAISELQLLRGDLELTEN